jgi:ABC-type transport system involved in multi-copper enzyme maturation permease subunit
MFAVPYQLPPVSEHPLLWKERFLGGPPLFFSPVVLVPAVPFLVTGALIMVFWFLRALFLDRGEYERTLEAWGLILKFFYYLFLGCYLMGLAWRAGACVARERQQQTLEPLLLLPVERREILLAKLVGCLWRGWPWLALLAAVIAFGTLSGAYHPFSAVAMCLAPLPLILFIATLGLVLSVGMRTVLRANLVMVLAPIVLLGCTSWGFEAFSFSVTHNGLQADFWRFWFAFVQEAFLLAASYCAWRIALVMFENRADSTAT